MANLLASSFNSLPIHVGYWEIVEALGLGEIGPFKQRAGRIAFLWGGNFWGSNTALHLQAVLAYQKDSMATTIKRRKWN